MSNCNLHTAWPNDPFLCWVDGCSGQDNEPTYAGKDKDGNDVYLPRHRVLRAEWINALSATSAGSVRVKEILKYFPEQDVLTAAEEEAAVERDYDDDDYE